MPKKKSVRRKDNKKRKRLPRAKAAVRARKATPKRGTAHNKKRKKIRGSRGDVRPVGSVAVRRNRPGAEAAGQSGDIEGLSSVARADSESVEELAEEGQAFEAEVLAGVEKADDEAELEVTTHEVLEDDVPSEYDGER
jgi:hypothetical protein